LRIAGWNEHFHHHGAASAVGARQKRLTEIPSITMESWAEFAVVDETEKRQ